MKILSKLVVVVLALILELVFLVVGSFIVFGRSHGRIVDTRYRNKERVAAFSDYHYHPSPEATARFQEEVRLMHKHEDWKWNVGYGLFFALNGVWIYYYFRHKCSTTTPNNGRAMKKIGIIDAVLIFGAPALYFIGWAFDTLGFDPYQKVSLLDLLGVLISVLIAFLVFASPQLAWFIVCRNLKVSRSTIYGGLIGANVVLLGLRICFLCIPNDGNSMEWILYFPFAIVALLLGGLIGRLCRGRQAGCAEPPTSTPPHRPLTDKQS